MCKVHHLCSSILTANCQSPRDQSDDRDNAPATQAIHTALATVQTSAKAPSGEQQ